MEKNLLREIRYLTNLIQQHQTSSEGKLLVKNNLDNSNKGQSKSFKSVVRRFPENSQSFRRCSNERDREVKCKVPVANVYINPNFRRQNPVIHINPNVPTRPPIHVNPKIVKEENTLTDKVQSCVTDATVVNEEESTRMPMKKSVYVHPQLMRKLVSAAESEKTETLMQKDIIELRPKQIPNTNNTNTFNIVAKKQSNANTLFLSRRKLVRKGYQTTLHTDTRRSKCSTFSSLVRSTTDSSKTIGNTSKMNPAVQSAKKDHSVQWSDFIKLKTSRYKVVRATPQVRDIKKQCMSKLNNEADLVTIGGVVYKSSRNRLVRRSLPLKRKSMGSIKRNKSLTISNGKNSRKLIVCKDTSNRSINDTSTENALTERKRSVGSLQKYNRKSIVSNKAKQRSIQILRNKMRKNNQPCLLYQKFGYCANHEKGICHKLHDKKQVSLCKRFLQGKCLLDDCPLSHDVGPEKMPTCKYFLEGCCLREACPYRHIKVSSKTSICIEFLKGYCAKGNECKQRHERVCPEFEKTGKCPKGKYCPYPHKSHPSTVTQINNHFRGRASRTRKLSIDTPTSSIQENKLRYYETSDTLGQDISRKRRRILKKLEFAKLVQIDTQTNETPVDDRSEVIEITDTEFTENDSEISDDNELPRRRPLGSLPAYIPIN